MPLISDACGLCGADWSRATWNRRRLTSSPHGTRDKEICTRRGVRNNESVPAVGQRRAGLRPCWVAIAPNGHSLHPLAATRVGDRFPEGSDSIDCMLDATETR